MTIKPEEPKQPGKLIICSTPIGNLKDISLRVIEALGQVDAVLAEDTRVTCKLLNHLKINPPLERCDENVIRSRLDSLVERILDGENLAYVSDAGTPSVSDPGAVLVSAVRDKGLTVEVLPGASAVLTALVASGFTAPGFYFGGFLPRKAEKQAKLFEQLASLPAVLVFFESPHRVMATLKAIELAYPNRRVCLARELTKLYEEVLIDTAHG
ncbi:MAG: 16S rRNA (cytidine(1402)-2'-O)-methyltransferase, partial [Coriobacteriales bacterium]|nr:16S rRNA (cytidine(1402)-2'-O)-methyltransferase [Coriobacteriales bacterium]